MRIYSALIAMLAGVWAFSVSAEVPTSARSIAVALNVTPALKLELRQKSLSWGAPIFIRVFKRSARLELWVEHKQGHFVLFKEYDICAFSGGLGPKTQEGDQQAPEGFYYVNAARMNPWSRYHLAFNLGYPNAYDRAHGYTGSALMVHGDCVSIGCFAMTDKSIEEIYVLAEAALNYGQPFFRVHVFPFELTDISFRLLSERTWWDFWQNLKEGYDFFENHGRPPNVVVRQSRYYFE